MIDAVQLLTNFGYTNGSVLRECMHCGIPFYGAKSSVACKICAKELAAKAMAAIVTRGVIK